MMSSMAVMFKKFTSGSCALRRTALRSSDLNLAALARAGFPEPLAASVIVREQRTAFIAHVDAKSIDHADDGLIVGAGIARNVELRLALEIGRRGFQLRGAGIESFVIVLTVLLGKRL